MKKYYAFLDSKLHGIGAHIRFEAKNKTQANAIAAEQAVKNYKSKVGGAIESEIDETFKCEAYVKKDHDEFFPAPPETKGALKHWKWEVLFS